MDRLVHFAAARRAQRREELRAKWQELAPAVRYARLYTAGFGVLWLSLLYAIGKYIHVHLVQSGPVGDNLLILCSGAAAGATAFFAYFWAALYARRAVYLGLGAPSDVGPPRNGLAKLLENGDLWPVAIYLGLISAFAFAGGAWIFVKILPLPGWPKVKMSIFLWFGPLFLALWLMYHTLLMAIRACGREIVPRSPTLWDYVWRENVLPYAGAVAVIGFGFGLVHYLPYARTPVEEIAWNTAITAAIAGTIVSSTLSFKVRADRARGVMAAGAAPYPVWASPYVVVPILIAAGVAETYVLERVTGWSSAGPWLASAYRAAICFAAAALGGTAATLWTLRRLEIAGDAPLFRVPRRMRAHE